MQVHREINLLPSFKNAVVTIGAFDGVHTGHLQIFKLLKQEALALNGESVIITFHPHPRMVLNAPASKENKYAGLISLLNTPEEKIQLIGEQGINHLVVVPFTHEFSLLTAEQYIKNFLVEKFHPHTIIIGYDHRFGKERKGNYKLLEAYADEFNYIVKEIPEHVINNVTISSTKIRDAIFKADIETTNRFLGYEFSFDGIVVEGDKRGRTLGFPTANLRLTDANKILPADGVYAVEVAINNEAETSPNKIKIKLKGMMNIGYRPTIGGIKKMIEVNIFDFNDDIYERKLRIIVKKYLRAEQKFNGLEELKSQLSRDKENAISALSKKPESHLS